MLNVFIVYCKLQSTQLDRVISKVEVRKGREEGTIHRWFTGVVLLSCLPAIIILSRLLTEGLKRALNS